MNKRARTRLLGQGVLLGLVGCLLLGCGDSRPAEMTTASAPVREAPALPAGFDELVVMEVVKRLEEQEGAQVKPPRQQVRLEFEQVQIGQPAEYAGPARGDVPAGTKVYPVKTAYQRLWAKGRTADRVAISRQFFFYQDPAGAWVGVDKEPEKK